ncbi:N-acyl-D-amino-acid deacylase [Betaproteobacteria bacterium GR16-43]|nr:N-acyl-D-amino-acid deacylase [Betaproteobacteria bacterium GR16-43]
MFRTLTRAAFLALACTSALAADPPYDLLIKNGRIVDGTGSPWYRADLAVRGDTIVKIAPTIDSPAVRTVDAKGAAVAPGFIDVHTHASRGIFQVPTADNYIRQGVTTIMEGPDGQSPVPLKPFLDKLEALPKSINIGSFIGHGDVRTKVLAHENRHATPAEMEQMKALVVQGMRDGAFGLSTGLFYTPANFAPLSEVIDLERVSGAMGGVHTSHMRDEAAGVVQSVKDTIAIGEQGKLPTQISHHKMIGKANWGKSVETLKLIDEARARGVDATIDQYPYTASSTTVEGALLPAWTREGGREGMVKRLKDPAMRAKIRAETEDLLVNERGGGDANNVQIASCDFDMSLAGKRLGNITKERGLEPTMTNAAETVLWLVETGRCRGIFHAIDEGDLVRILAHPATMIASDGEVPIFDRGSPHPRSYGTFVRVLGLYTREKKVISLEDAVRKMSSYPAARIGLVDRGVLRPGMKADIVVFDPNTVADQATYEKPHQYPVGVNQVVVNGRVVFENGAMTAERPGKVVYGPSRQLP